MKKETRIQKCIFSGISCLKTNTMHCEETRECIIEVLSKDESFNKVIDDSIERIIKKSKMKSDYFYE